ncbi:hypothetical protein KAT80_01300 [Candidatus Pacearchaeota archaeon]|nr:hypothetical protein [Candidatus Pacearchaeota archaeon]
MRKKFILIFIMMFLTSIVVAQDYKLEVSTIPEDKIFEPGKIIQLKIIIYDSNNNPVQNDVSLILKDIREDIIKEITIKSNTFQEIQLPENILAGEGEIIITYKNVEIKESFRISKSKLIDVKIEGEELILTNIGNTIYDKEIYITIGSTTGSKNPNLNLGESVSYRLVAPEGVYNIKVMDENKKVLFTKGEVKLTGTGQVIAAVDKGASGRSGITGGISPDEGADEAFLSYTKNSKFIYVFMLTIFGAMILLAIERRYRKKSK